MKARLDQTRHTWLSGLADICQIWSMLFGFFNHDLQLNYSHIFGDENRHLFSRKIRLDKRFEDQRSKTIHGNTNVKYCVTTKQLGYIV